MWKIKNLKIEQLWGEQDFNIEFNLNLNIFIGTNGIGKTTILRILNSALKIDTLYFRELLFKSIKILMVDEHFKQKTLRIEKDENGIHFYLSNKTIYQDSDDFEEVFFTNKQRKNKLNDTKLKIKLKRELGIPKIQWLPTNRISTEYENEDNYLVYRNDRYSNYQNEPSIDPINLKLKELIDDANYQITKINQLIINEDAKFRNKLLQSNFKFISTSPKSEDNIRNTFQTTLSILRNENKIKQLFTKIKDISDTVCDSFDIDLDEIKSIAKEMQDKKGEFKFSMDYVLKISAFSFLIQYEKDYDFYNEKIEKIQLPIKNLKDNFNNIFRGKFKIDTNNECIFYKNTTPETFKINNFSSGEKQMLIFVLECALHLNTPCLYLTDEPEISLHLKWQKKYLETLLTTNQENQIFVATHSPDIVGKYYKSIINLKKSMVKCHV